MSLITTKRHSNQKHDIQCRWCSQLHYTRIHKICWIFFHLSKSVGCVKPSETSLSHIGICGVALRRVAVTIGLCSVRLSEGSCPALPRRAARRRLSGVPCVLFPHRHPIVSIARTAPVGMRRGFRVLGVRLNLESARLVRARGVEPRLLPWRIGGAPIVSWPSARCRSP